MRSFFKAYKDILVYHDYGPLLLFWNIADLANNRVLWMSYGEALDGGNEWAYFQYCLYFVVASGHVVQSSQHSVLLPIRGHVLDAVHLFDHPILGQRVQ
jgi:hypothetical protein